MRRTLIVTFTLLLALLSAQPRQLPVVEIQGEGQVKIPLSQRGPLQFVAEAPRDSIPYLTPTTLPMALGTFGLPRARLKGAFEARMGTDFTLDLKARLHGLHPALPYLRVNIEEQALPNSFDRQSFEAFAKVVPDSTMEFDTRLRWQSADAAAYQQSAFNLAFFHRADSLRDRNWVLRNLSSSLWWENSSQLHDGSRTRHHNPGFWHSHSLETGKHRVDSRFGSSMGRFGLGSVYELPLKYPGLKKAQAGLMTDFRHLLPMLEVSYEKVFNPRFRLVAGNYPSLEPLTRSELAELYPWAGQPRLGRMPMSPLDLRIAVDHTLPPLFGLQPGPREKTPQNSLRISWRSAYDYNRPVLRAATVAATPVVSMEPAWNNALSADARIRLPWGWLEQTLSLPLEHLPHQRLIRSPYSPMLTASTAFTYKIGTFDASIRLAQYLHQEDQLGHNLPEVSDLSIKAAYSPCPALQLTAELLNVFNTPRHLWKGLPDQGRELRVGARYLWR